MSVKSSLNRLDQRILGDSFRRRPAAPTAPADAPTDAAARVDERSQPVPTHDPVLAADPAGPGDPVLAGDQTREQLRARDARARHRRGIGTVVRAVLRVIAVVIALLGAIIVLGIVFENTPVNPANDIPTHLWPAARALTRPFHDLVTADTAVTTITVNWGIAAAVYFLVALVLRTLGRRRR